ncbi:MAG: TMEM165/GDT1 family protein [Mycobacteriales bacterium]
MTLSLGVLAVTFLIIFPVELPDKTVVATLVLAARFRALPVLAGVSAAFFVQCLIAVAAGQLLTLLPKRVVLIVVAGLFATGALILYRESRRHAESGPEEVAARDSVGFLRTAATAFGVLFAAEWGDASQLATVALTARYREPASVFLGAFAALVAVGAIAVVIGRVVLRVVPLVWVERVAAVVFTLLGALAVVEAVRV